MSEPEGTSVLQVQALRAQLAQARADLARTQSLLRLRTDQCDRRQQTIDALRMALTERMARNG